MPLSGKRHCESIFPKNTTQCPQLGLEPGPFDSEIHVHVTTLTMKPLCLLLYKLFSVLAIYRYNLIFYNLLYLSLSSLTVFVGTPSALPHLCMNYHVFCSFWLGIPFQNLSLTHIHTC